MEKPLVSVVLCTYNGGKFLAEQLESILRQTYKPLELIISDDASEDDTRQVLKLYEDHPAVHIFYQAKNIGLTSNFAFAAAQTKGALIAFSDQDDIWLENKIEQLAAAIGDSPLVYSNSLLVDEAGNSMQTKLSDLRNMYSGNDSRGYILFSCVWGHGMLITRKLLTQSLPMPEVVHHDIWIVFQAFLNGGIIYLDEVLTHYRQHSHSASKTLPEKKSERTKEYRYAIYQMKLSWIKLMQQNERKEFQPFYQRLLKLYEEKDQKKYVFPLLIFLLKYRKKIFQLSKKGITSQLVEILKQARGEKP
ncbi:MAG: glycosyltransferase [Chitinophagaceae bacterium]|nr:glycosyltransferase [Chitinophagaceae bacterium]